MGKRVNRLEEVNVGERVCRWEGLCRWEDRQRVYVKEEEKVSRRVYMQMGKKVEVGGGFM